MNDHLISDYTKFVVKHVSPLVRVNVPADEHAHVGKFNSLEPWAQFVVKAKEIHKRSVEFEMQLVLPFEPSFPDKIEFTLFVSRKHSPVKMIDLYDKKTNDLALSYLRSHPEAREACLENWKTNVLPSIQTMLKNIP